MHYFRFFINHIHFIVNYSLIYLILFIYSNLLFNYLINLSHFDIYLYIICVLNLISIFMQHYHFFIYLVHFIFNHFIININFKLFFCFLLFTNLLFLIQFIINLSTFIINTMIQSLTTI